MENVYIVQLFAMLLAGCGLIGLSLTGQLYGTSLTRREKMRHGDEWAHKGDVRRLPFRWETLAAVALVLVGLFILWLTKLEVCGFLAYWMNGLPQAVRMMFACR